MKSICFFSVVEEEWAGEGLGLEECLFCAKVSKTLEKNITHMSLVHSFFIPDADYVCDLEGLMQYLGKILFSLMHNYVLLEYQFVGKYTWCFMDLSD